MNEQGYPIRVDDPPPRKKQEGGHYQSLVDEALANRGEWFAFPLHNQKSTGIHTMILQSIARALADPEIRQRDEVVYLMIPKEEG